MPGTLVYASLTELKNWLHVEAADDTDNTLYTLTLSVASRSIDNACNTTWATEGAVPPPVKLASLILASRLVKRKDSPEGVLGFGEMGGVVRVTSIDRDVVSLIGPYRLHRATGDTT